MHYAQAELDRAIRRSRARSPRSRCAGSARSARRWRGGSTKRHAQTQRRAGMDADRRGGPDPLPQCARSRGRRPRRQGDARRPGKRAVRGAGQRRASNSARARRHSHKLRSARRRYARLARPAVAAYGETTARAIAAAHRSEPTLDLSVKGDAAGWAERLGGIVLPTGSVRLDTHKPVAELEGYADGDWWVQDAAAALPAQLLRARPGMRVADLCAAPGGKAAELAAAGAKVRRSTARPSGSRCLPPISSACAFAPRS